KRRRRRSGSKLACSPPEVVPTVRFQRIAVEAHAFLFDDASDRVNGASHARAELRLTQRGREQQREFFPAVKYGIADVHTRLLQAGEDRDALALDFRAAVRGLAEVMEIRREAIADVDAGRGDAGELYAQFRFRR